MTRLATWRRTSRVIQLILIRGPKSAKGREPPIAGCPEADLWSTRSGHLLRPVKIDAVHLSISIVSSPPPATMTVASK